MPHTTEEAPTSPITKVEVYHDGENCPIPGAMRDLNVGKMWDTLLRKAIACIEGQASAERKELAKLDWSWHLFLSYNPKKSRHPSPKVKQRIIDQGIKLVDPGGKANAVDVFMKCALTEAEERWRQASAAAKQGLLIVVLAGDADYAADIRRLHKERFSNTDNKNIDGVNVVIVYDKCASAKPSYLMTVGPQNRVLGEWHEIVQQSQTRVVPTRAMSVGGSTQVNSGKGQHGSPCGGGGTAARRTSSRPPGRKLNPHQRDTTADCTISGNNIIARVSLTLPVARFLKRFNKMQDLNDSLIGLHAALSATWHKEEGAKDTVICLWESVAIGAPAITEAVQDEALKLVESLVTSLAKKTLPNLNVPGMTKQQLTKDLERCMSQYEVGIFIPGFCNADLSLKTNQLRLERESEVSDDEVKKLCWDYCKIWLNKIEVIQGCTVASIDHRSANNMYSAKQNLLQLGSKAVQFLENPKMTLILVYKKGNKDGVENVKRYIESIAVKTERVPVVSDCEVELAKLKLMVRSWKTTWASIKTPSLWRGFINETKGAVEITGRLSAVDAASQIIKDKASSVNTATIENFAHDSFKTWHASARKALEEASGSVGYKMGKNLTLAFFPEDEDVAEEVMRNMRDFHANYTEECWEKHDEASIKSLREDYKSLPGKVCSDFDLCAAAWQPWGQSSAWRLILCGHKDRVREAVGWLEERCKLSSPGKRLSLSAASPILAALLRHPANKEVREKLKNAIECVAKNVKVIHLNKGEHVLSIEAPGNVATEVKKEAEEQLIEINSKVRHEVLHLSPNQMQYFQQAEGQRLLRQVENEFGCRREEGDGEERSTQSHDSTDCMMPLLATVLQNGARMEVAHGNAVENKCRVSGITNAANEFLLTGHCRGIAGAIADRGGPQLIAECSGLLSSLRGPVSPGSVVSTSAQGMAELGFKAIIHAVLWPYSHAGTDKLSKMRTIVKEILGEAEKLKMDSIVLPILATGIYGWPTQLALTGIFEGVAEWSASGSAHLERIVLMDLDDSKAREAANFLDGLIQNGLTVASAPLKPVLHPPKQPRFRWLRDENDKRAGWVAYDYDQSIQLDYAFERREVSVVICGDINKKASDSINMLPDHQHATYEVHFNKGGEGYCATQINQASKFPRKVKCEGPLTHEQAMHFVPMFKEVYEEWKKDQGGDQGVASSAVSYVFKPVQEDRQTAPVPIAPGSAVLCMKGFNDAPASAVEKLKTALRKAQKTSKHNITILEEETFEDALAKLQALMRSESAGVSVEKVAVADGQEGVKLISLGDANMHRAHRVLYEWNVGRKDEKLAAAYAARAVQFPGHITNPSTCPVDCPDWFKWTAVDTDGECSIEEVQSDSVEYTKVMELMHNETGLGNKVGVWLKPITMIERVVNPDLWAAYFRRCQTISEISRNRGSAGEVWVKHGTSKTDPRIICQGDNGPDFNHTRENCMFGRGVYTAEDATYVDRGYYYQKSDGSRQMLLCRFAAGTVHEMTFSEATRSLLAAPKGFDSVRGDVLPGRGYFALVGYKSNLVYPAYIVTYKP